MNALLRGIRSRVAPSALLQPTRGKATVVTNGKAWAVDIIKDAAGVTGKQAELAFNALLGSITSSVAKGERVTFQGFGTFERASRAARAGRNPSTGAPLQIPASNVPKFKAGTAFKDAVKGK